VVPITYIFFYYTEPHSIAVKAQIVLAGTEKRAYRYPSRTGCVDKRKVAQGCFCDPHMQGNAPACWQIEAEEGFTCEDLCRELGALELKALGRLKHGDAPQPGQAR
jgi:hypothetical protein